MSEPIVGYQSDVVETKKAGGIVSFAKVFVYMFMG